MYKSYLQKDGKTYVLENGSKFSIIETTNNIEDVLIAKNNIEEITNILNDITKNIKFTKLNFISDNLVLIGLDIISIIILLFPLPTLIKTGGILLLLSSGFISIQETKNYLKEKQKYFNKADVLKKMLTLEKEKLNVLEKNSKTIENATNTKEKNIDTSEKIKSLYKKLEIINFYTNNASKLSYIYDKNGEDFFKKQLSSDYSNEDLDFLIYLINKRSEEQIKKEEQKIKKIK